MSVVCKFDLAFCSKNASLFLKDVTPCITIILLCLKMLLSKFREYVLFSFCCLSAESLWDYVKFKGLRFAFNKGPYVSDQSSSHAEQHISYCNIYIVIFWVNFSYYYGSFELINTHYFAVSELLRVDSDILWKILLKTFILEKCKHHCATAGWGIWTFGRIQIFCWLVPCKISEWVCHFSIFF